MLPSNVDQGQVSADIVRQLAANDTDTEPAAATPAKDRTEGAAKSTTHKRPRKAAAHAAGTVKKTASDHKTAARSAQVTGVAILVGCAPSSSHVRRCHPTSRL